MPFLPQPRAGAARHGEVVIYSRLVLEPPLLPQMPHSLAVIASPIHFNAITVLRGEGGGAQAAWSHSTDLAMLRGGRSLQAVFTDC